MAFTQASQLRLVQRSTDTGWISQPVVLERSSDYSGASWATALNTEFSSVLTVNGGVAGYYGMFIRQANWKAVPHRLYVGNVAPVTNIQRAGILSHVKPDGTVYDYILVITPDGYLEPFNIANQKWQCAAVGDTYQFEASWTIS